MIRNYLKIAWRNLRKNKMFSIINILGLTIGITACMMIFIFIIHEYSIDRFHKNAGNIYRVMRGYNETKTAAPYFSGPYAPALLNDFPGEITQAVRIQPNSGLVTFKEKAFREQKIYFADDNFFTFFSFPLSSGDPETVLKNPSGAVISEAIAKKYFGNENPIGKVIDLDKTYHLKITGVSKPLHSGSHLDFDLVLPVSNLYQYSWFDKWINNNMYTYVMLDKNTTQASIEKRLPRFMDKYMKADMEKLGSVFKLSLVPLTDVYMHSTSDFDQTYHGDAGVVRIFISIALLILIIGCINFINLSTIRAIERSKEVGLRKVLGAMRNQLVGQFIAESLLITLIAIFLSIGLLYAVKPLYDDLLGYEVVVPWNNWQLYGFLGGILLLVGILAGAYPALVLSGFSPIAALKGKLRPGKGGTYFRQALVVVQFGISVFLIIGSIIIVNQMRYVKNKDLGYNKDQTMIVRIDNDDFYNKIALFKKQLAGNENIQSVSAMSGEPGGFFDELTFEVEGKNGQVWKSRSEFADFEFVKTLGLKIIAGRDLSPQFPADSFNSVLINRTAAIKLGYTPETVIGLQLKNTLRDSIPRKIVGVIEDYNFLSLKEKMEPLVISPADDRRVALVRIKAGRLGPAISAVSNLYSSVAPVYPFEYTFLDQKFEELYRKDIRQQTILSIFSALAIFIACLGLFGLASFATNKRIKEIGVRKVLGSSTEKILVLITKDLLKPVILATVMAIPMGYWFMSKWLENFAYQIPMRWWIFAIAALVTILVAIVTVSLKALKAATTNPAISLRTD
jgi:putative ABC transport system permease protein